MSPGRWLYTLPLRVRSICRRSRVERDLEDEIQHYLDMKIDENLAKGMSGEEARRSALIALGGLDQKKEECRDARGWRWLDSLFRDFRYAIRSFRRSPGFVASVIATLALGIGTVTAILSAVDQTVLRKPFPNDDGFFVFGWDARGHFAAISYPVQIMPCIERGKSFETFAVRASGRGTLNTGTETVGAEYGSIGRDFFSAFDGKAELGRLFRPDEFATASRGVMVLTDKFWKEYFGGDSSVIGRSVVLDSRTYQIVGVLSRGFSPPIPWNRLSAAISHVVQLEEA